MKMKVGERERERERERTKGGDAGDQSAETLLELKEKYKGESFELIRRRRPRLRAREPRGSHMACVREVVALGTVLCGRD